MEELPQCPPPMPEPMTERGVAMEARNNERISPEEPSKEIQRLIALKRYEIRVRFLDHGMVIEVGCKSFAFSSVEDGVANLHAYMENPVHVQKAWIEKVGY